MPSFVVAAVWIHEGLWRKILGRSRHELEIVESLPNVAPSEARQLLVAIGAAEVSVGTWVLSGRRPYVAATAQTLLLAAMNAAAIVWARDRAPTPSRLAIRSGAFLGLAWWAAHLENQRD